MATQLGTITIQAPIEPFLTLEAVARVIGRTENTIKEWVEAGKFPPSVKIGDKKVWTNLAVGVWMAWVQVCPAIEPKTPESETPVKSK